MRWALCFAVLPLLACYDVSAVSDTGGRWKTTSNVKDWRDEIIYQLLVDRFADGDLNNDQGVDPTALGRYQGGDWQGVIDHVDYLKALGVTAIWISPVVRNVDTDANFDAYHGYWQQDMTNVNPHMGDLAKLREMVDVLHANGMKVILDIVTNHVGQLFYYDINKNGVPDETLWYCPTGSNCSSAQLVRVTEYDPDFDPNGIQSQTSLGFSGPAPANWIYIPAIHRMPPMPPEFQNTEWYNRKGRITDYTVREQVLLGDFPGGLKDLKTSNPDVQAALTNVFDDWIDKADFDGFRIDTLKHVEHGFWQYFAPHVRMHAQAIGKKNFFMFGEAFDGDDALVGSYTRAAGETLPGEPGVAAGDEVDSTFFFPQKFAVIDRVIKYNQSATSAIEDQFKTLAADYSRTPKALGPVGADGTPLSTQQLMVNFLDNHDVPRFLYDKPSPAALHSALAYIFTEPGLPCVYYGTEQQLAGGNDPSNRERLWDSNFSTSGPTFQWIRGLADMRKKFAPLRRGDMEIKWKSDATSNAPDVGIFAFERATPDGKRVLVVLNFSDPSIAAQPSSSTHTASGAPMPTGFAPGTTLVSVTPGVPPMTVTVGGTGAVDVTVPQRKDGTGGAVVEPGVRVFVDMADAAGIDPIQ